MKKFFPFIFLALALGMTSCSINDNELIDVEEFHLSATDPPSEGAGEEDELEPNN